ncbi:hypothetical protein BJX64DRAFT_292345 [Aspergillus heterothallicus]
MPIAKIARVKDPPRPRHPAPPRFNAQMDLNGSRLYLTSPETLDTETREIQRERLRLHIQTLESLVKGWEGQQLSETQLAVLRVSVFRHFQYSSATEDFFLPMSPENFRRMSVDNDDRPQWENKRLKRSSDHNGKRYRRLPNSLRKRVSYLATCFFRETHITRISADGEVQARLATLSGWKWLMDYTPTYHSRVYGRDGWNCEQAWAPLEDHRPHFKAMIWTAAEAVDGQPLRSEMLAVLGIMLERMNTPSLRHHVVIPVLLVSIVGPQHGRILGAYFDGGNLIVQMSDLVPLSPEEPEPMAFLLWWWAAQCDSFSSTKRLPWDEKRPLA